ncbi:MAG: NUDIX domain-containing protein [Bacteroidetes bacterium]|nr:NUDIX domain-containing protein [Bacteroidota bacterium]
MITVYFNDIAIRITNKSDTSFINIESIQVSCNEDIESLLDSLFENEFTNDINVFGYDIIDIFNDISQKFKYIEAAGGVVQNPENDYLLIKRLGIWDLPKGKIEKGELIMEAAIREVYEETGLKYVKIIKYLPNTFHIYFRKGIWYLKKTYWFLMRNNTASDLIPQIEEDITEAVWMDIDTANKAIAKSYRSISETLGWVFI